MCLIAHCILNELKQGLTGKDPAWRQSSCLGPHSESICSRSKTWFTYSPTSRNAEGHSSDAVLEPRGAGQGGKRGSWWQEGEDQIDEVPEQVRSSGSRTRLSRASDTGGSRSVWKLLGQNSQVPWLLYFPALETSNTRLDDEQVWQHAGCLSLYWPNLNSPFDPCSLWPTRYLLLPWKDSCWQSPSMWFLSRSSWTGSKTGILPKTGLSRESTSWIPCHPMGCHPERGSRRLYEG